MKIKVTDLDYVEVLHQVLYDQNLLTERMDLVDFLQCEAYLILSELEVKVLHLEFSLKFKC